MDNKYQKDVAEPNINVTNLNSIFECAETGDLVDTSTGEIISTEDALAEVKVLKNEIKNIEDSLPDVDQIILNNIDRANNILDKVETQIINGNMTGTMLEACATLINAVTSAATSVTGISYNNEMLDIKREELRIRDKKVMMDSIKDNTPTQVTGDVNITNQNLVMTREELLKELRGE